MIPFIVIYILIGIITVLYLSYDRKLKEFNFFPSGMFGGWFTVFVLILAFLIPPPFLFLYGRDHWQEYQASKILKGEVE